MSSTILTESRLYAIESIDHTMNYDKFTDGDKKMERIVLGNFCQLWLCEFCRINGIDYVKDDSSPHIPDKMDLSINGWAIDCKSSVVENMPLQVSPHAKNQQAIDVYCFFSTDRQASFIKPLGMIRRKRFMELANKVEQDQIIPGTKIKQSFGSSYFLDKENLTDFFKSIEYLAERKKYVKSA